MAGLKYLVFGSSGQVGTALKKLLNNQGIFLDKNQVDLSNPGNIKPALEKYKPDVIINASAYTAVDNAEKEEDLAYKINSIAPEKMAEYASENNIPFIHYSTDYVFDGSGDHKRKEDEKTSPLSSYGRSKLAGDEKIVKLGGKFLIFRTSWVYSEAGKNFLLTMLKLGSERENLRIVSDQVGAPTYAFDIADYTLKALEKAIRMQKFPSGIYNFCNAGETNWCEFAKEIFKIAKEKGVQLKIKDITPIKTEEYPTPAKRPLNSRLDSQKLKDTFGFVLPAWQNALKRCMENL